MTSILMVARVLTGHFTFIMSYLSPSAGLGRGGINLSGNLQKQAMGNFKDFGMIIKLLNVYPTGKRF